jgi:hypothetical protein
MRTCFLTLGWPFLGPLLFPTNGDRFRLSTPKPRVPQIGLGYVKTLRRSIVYRLRGKPENGNSATAQGEDHRPRCSPNSLWLPLIVSITGRFSLRRANSSRQRVV